MSTSSDTFYVLHCENSIDGILTAIYDAFVLKKRLSGSYHDNISISVSEHDTFQLFSEWIEVATDAKKAELTAFSIQKKLGENVFLLVFRALCHYDSERATIIMRFLVRAFQTGPAIFNHLSDPYVMRIHELSRKVSNEAHYFLEFIRFHQVEQTLYSRIEPKCYVLPLISDHFADRFPNENWIIYDKVHQVGSVHHINSSFFLMSDPALDIDLSSYDASDSYISLWKVFFSTIGIEERKNTRCQNTHLPKWYRKNMTEFLF